MCEVEPSNLGGEALLPKGKPPKAGPAGVPEPGLARAGVGRSAVLGAAALLLSRSPALGHRLPFRMAWVMVTGLHEGCWEGPSGHCSVRL